MQPLSGDEDILEAANDWLLLVRHTAVSDDYKGLCYGASDIELSPRGKEHAHVRAAEVARLHPTMIVHSGLTRARILAELIAQRCGMEPQVDPRLAEMNFGAWELRAWNDIFLEVGHGMARLISEPATYSPPGGETAHALRDRVTSWFFELPRRGRIVAVCHGGAIGALRGSLAGLPAREWPTFVPAYGEQVVMKLPSKPLR